MQYTIVRLFIFVFSFFGQQVLMASPVNDSAGPAAKQLNILLFTADDLDRNSLGCYGGKVPDISPQIDRFARQSLRFTNAFVNSAICVPSRGILATGLYEHNSGVNGFYTMKAESQIPLIMELLRDHHYEVGILGKVGHSTPKKGFVWDYAFDQQELGNGRSPQQYYLKARGFFEQAKQKGKPFYFMVNSHDPHRPYFNPALPLKEGEEKPSRIYTPEEVAVPGFVPDLPEVRRELSYYFNSTRRLDDTFGKVMQALQESGEAENTLVVFLSDNGIALPFAKANAYYASNRTPFLVRWPRVIQGGSVDDAHFISTIDFLPTVLEAVGMSLPQQADGRSFLTLLQGKRQHGSDRVYTQIDYKAGGGPTPIRSIQTKQYAYIFNAWADGERVYANNNEGLTMKAMEAAAPADAAVAARVKAYRVREPEELYDLQTDPDCIRNLISDPGHASRAAAFRKELEAWMIRTADPLLPVYQARHKPVQALEAFYTIYPDAAALDKDKKNYSRSAGVKE